MIFLLNHLNFIAFKLSADGLHEAPSSLLLVVPSTLHTARLCHCITEFDYIPSYFLSDYLHALSKSLEALMPVAGAWEVHYCYMLY